MSNPRFTIKLLGQSNIYEGGRRIAETVVSGFTGFQIIRAIDAAADAFAFSIPWDPERYKELPLRPFLKNACEIKYGDELISLGYIEQLKYGTSAEGRMIEVQGRSATGITIEWSAGALYTPSGAKPQIKAEFRGMKFNQIADTLFIPGAIRSFPDLGPFGEEAVSSPSQSLYDFLQSLASTAGLWAVPQPQGHLHFKKLGTSAPVVDLLENEAPLISAVSNHDSTKRARWYLMAATQWGSPTTVASALDETAEPGIKGTRILEQPQQAAKNFDELVKQARSRAIMDGYSIDATVTGFQYNTGKTWRTWKAGDIVRLSAPSAFVMKPTAYIIRRATLQFDENSGEITKLDLVLPELFSGQVRDVSTYPFGGIP